jgi:hypothetical protein
VTWIECDPPLGYVAIAGDCDDDDVRTYSGAPEANDARDNQCPGDHGYGVVDEISGAFDFQYPASLNLLSWEAQGAALLYEVARATAPDFSANCTLAASGIPYWEDPDLPPPGEIYHYLVRAKLPNTGSWGQDSTGAERTNICP